MKKTLIGVLVGAMVIGASAIPAFAASSASPKSANGLFQSARSGSKSNGVSVIKYRSTYNDISFGSVSCTGVHQTGKNFPGSQTSGGQDSFTCKSTTGLPLTNLTAGESMSLAMFQSGWTSDYFYGFNGSAIFATSFSGKVSSDRMSYTAVAGYY